MRIREVMSATALVLVYWLFAGQFSVTEALALLVAVSTALVLSVSISRLANHAFEFKAPWRRLLLRTAASIGKDSVKVGIFLVKALFRRPPCPAGPLSNQPFHFGDDSPREAARRALVALSISASPDRYVIDITADDHLSAHSLAGGAGPSDPEWPV